MYVSNAGVPADKLVGAGKTFIDQFKAKYGVTTGAAVHRLRRADRTGAAERDRRI